MPEELKVIVNDCLGLAQFLTQHLDEKLAVRYLCSITELSLEQWKESKRYLHGVDTTNRQTVEHNVRDIVRVFYNPVPENLEVEYLVRNLGLCPGFQSYALNFASYTQSSLVGAKDVASRLSDSSPVAPLSTDCNSAHGEVVSSHSSLNAPLHSEQSSYVSRVKSNLRPSREGSRSRGGNRDSSLSQPSGGNKRSSKSVLGTGTALDNSKKDQQKFVCLCVRSGSDETPTTLLKELESKWKGHGGLKVEAVSMTDYSSTFRVQMKLTPAMYNCLEDPSYWPARMIASRWKGNPRSVLQPLTSRVQTKRIYIGNLASSATTDQVSSNLRKIYESEMQSGILQSIETVVAPQRKNSTEDAVQSRISMCAILTSYPGKSLSDVKLKIDHFPLWLQKTVRYWRGPTPRSEETLKMQQLNW